MRLAVMMALALWGATARAGDAPTVTAGVELDVLPPVMSALAGELGLSGQVWAGQGRWRLRAVGAHMAFPDALGPPRPFEDQRLTVVAVIADRFFRDRFEGPWVGGGVEYWWSSVGHEVAVERRAWQAPVLTAGAGWIWKAWRGLYLNPWGAVHWTARGQTVQLGADSWEPRRVSAEVSLKVGWAFGG